MDKELAALLERVRARSTVDTDGDERQVAMAAANGQISDSRITIETMKAAQTIALAAEQPRSKR